MEQSHNQLFECINKLSHIVNEMKKIIQSCKKNVYKLDRIEDIIDKGEFSSTCSIHDYIQFMSIICSMYEQELDSKELIVMSLHEQESSFILSNYNICWKTMPFIDENIIQFIQQQISMDEQTKFKLIN